MVGEGREGEHNGGGGKRNDGGGKGKERSVIVMEGREGEGR